MQGCNFAAYSMNSKIFNKTGLEFFSGETAVLSGMGRSLEFLLLFGQAKRRRKIKTAPAGAEKQ